MEFVSVFSYELFGLLVDIYIVNWMLLGQDGYKMEGVFSFMVYVLMMKYNDKKYDSMYGNYQRMLWIFGSWGC